MGHPNTVNCKRCDRHFDAPGSLSWTRLCIVCSDEVLRENIEGLAAKSGPPFRRWRAGMILCAGGLLPEQLQTRS